MTRMIGTRARKSSNKFGISLTYSYLWRSAESTPVDFVFLLLTRHKMQASSALVSFVGSEILKQVWYFARLFVPLAVAEGTPVRKFSNEFGISLTYSYLCQHEKDDSYLLRVLCGALFQGSDVPAMCAKGH